MRLNGQRKGSLLMVILPLGLVLFLITMTLARRSSAVRSRVQHTKNIRRARNLADSAVAEGLALAHLKIADYVSSHKNLQSPNHDELLKGLQGQQWTIDAKNTKQLMTNDRFEIVALTASIPADTPIHTAHIADIEIMTKVKVKEARSSFTLRLRQRRAFRINDSQLAVFLCRRYHQYHLLLEGGGSL